MGTEKTAYHPPFTSLLTKFCPRWATVRGEEQVTAEPQRIDDIIEVLVDLVRNVDDEGETLRAMWRFIVRVGLLEFKSIARPFRRGDLHRLLGYGMTWLSAHQSEPPLADGSKLRRFAPTDVTLILVVPSITPTLREELLSLRLSLPASTNGYHLVGGFPLALLVIDLGAAAETENDELMRWFAGARGRRSLAARRWLMHHVAGARTMEPIHELPGFDVWMAQYLDSLPPEERLAGLAPEERLAGLAPEERLAGLAPEERLAGLTEAEQVLALPDKLLRLLPDDYLATLPADVQATIRARRGR